MIGETISHYKILEKIGEGGMGVVYKAEDMKLKRIIALKFLKPEALGSEEQKARFVTEAQAAAALDHPNICTIYEINDAEGETFISMAYIKGQSLKEKIESGPLKLKDALDIAIQVAQGLQEAHEKGVIHRDIKPANIMLTKKGQAKIMDFGLAKLAEGSMLTKAGTTLGTICFMSPQQARGEEVDNRTDIWSLGVVLYEMLTGQLPFRGEYEQAVVYSIINVEPEPITGLRSGIPMALEHIVNKCLEKETSDRCQHADELIVDLRRLKRDTSKVLPKPPGEVTVPETEAVKAVAILRPRNFIRAISQSPLLYAGAAVMVIILVVVGYLFWWSKRVPPVPKFKNPTRVTAEAGVEDYPTWSPDGGRLAYQWKGDIWVSQVTGGPPVNLTEDYKGTDSYPSWSPDGSQIAFWSSREEGGYFVMPAIGGSPRKVTERGRSRANKPQWSPDGEELACVGADSTVLLVEIVSLQHATSRRLILPKLMYVWELSWSPDGRFFAYVDAGGRTSPYSQLRVMRMSDGVSFPVTDGKMHDWSPSWSKDGNTIYFISNRGGSFDLWQQRLKGNGTPKGSPQQLTFGIEMRNAKFSPESRKLAYSKVHQASNVWRVPILKDRPSTWADAEQFTFEQSRKYSLEVSPDGKQLAFSTDRDGQWHIFVVDLKSREMKRVTTDPMSQQHPTWSPDGRELAFLSHHGENRDIWKVALDGGPVQQLTSHDAFDGHAKWSLDGKEIVFFSTRSGNADIWVMPAQGGEARQLTFHPAVDLDPDWSADGKWIIFTSDRTGKNQLWRVPSAGGRSELVTKERDGHSVLSPDGKKIYFKAEGHIWEVPAEKGAERQLTDLEGKSYGLDIGSPNTDGQYIYFRSAENIGDIWVMDVVENE